MRHDFSMAFHPQMDGQLEKTIQIIEDMLRMCVIDFGGQWDLYLSLIEFAYKTSYHTSIEWLHMKHCMKGSLDHLCVGKLERDR